MIKLTISAVYNRIKCSAFLRSVLTLSSGILLAQGVKGMAIPFISRLYAPDIIGEFALLYGNAGVIGSIASLGLMPAFMLPKQDEESRALCQLVSILTAGIASVVVLGLYSFSDVYTIFPMTEISYVDLLILLWLFVWFNTVSSTCYAYVNRFGLYLVMFWAPIIYAVLDAGLKIGFGLWHPSILWYTLSSIIAYALQIVYLCNACNPFLGVRSNLRRFIYLMIKYKRFPIYQMPANVLSTFGNQFLLQTMAGFYSASVLGAYTMAHTILSMPSALLARPVNNVYYREATQRYNNGENIGEFTQKILEVNVKFAVFPVMVLVIFGEDLFRIILGMQWERAGIFAGIIAVPMLVDFGAQCIGGSFTILGKNKWNLISSVYILFVGSALAVIKLLHPEIEINVYLVVMSVLLMGRTIVAQGILLWYTGGSLISYACFIGKFIVLPYAASIIILSYLK